MILQTLAREWLMSEKFLKTSYLSYSVPPEMEGETVSTLLRRGLGCSGSLIKQVKFGGLTLSGRPVILTDRARAGDILRVRLPEDPPSDILPVARSLDILWEDAHLLVVNKPAGVSVHPGPDHHEDTLGNFITAHYLDRGEHHLFRPVNRLDRGTSGLMVVAKHSYAQERLRQQFHTNRFRRRYLALCDGCPEPPKGSIALPIGRLEGAVLKRTVREDGAPAVTHYEVLQVCEPRTLVRLELETGRTHQIRVHMAHMGCPLTGDFLYGREQPTLIGRTALHSWELEFCHPVTGERLVFRAPLPEDMAGLLENKV